MKREIDYLAFDELEYRKRKEARTLYPEIVKGKKIFLLGRKMTYEALQEWAGKRAAETQEFWARDEGRARLATAAAPGQGRGMVLAAAYQAMRGQDGRSSCLRATAPRDGEAGIPIRPWSPHRVILERNKTHQQVRPDEKKVQNFTVETGGMVSGTRRGRRLGTQRSSSVWLASGSGKNTHRCRC